MNQSKFFFSFLLLVSVSGQAKEGFVAHEWGTFTSVQSAAGQTLEGLHHEDEPLPAFVHGRDAIARRRKSIDFRPQAGTPTGVTQRLETPVIFLYSDEAKKVKIDLDFPQGIISQWYPENVTHRPRVGRVRAVADGMMTWLVDLATKRLQVPEVPADGIWEPSRRVPSNYLSVGGENERFIFYRGVGRFTLPVRITSRGADFNISNPSKAALPNVFAITTTADKGSIIELGALEAGQSVGVTGAQLSAQLKSHEEYSREASQKIKAALVENGLYGDEAQALVDTWKRSYFRTLGTRILYITPRSWIDELLPLEITPTPNELNRSYVGRIEILSSAEENALLALARDAQRAGRTSIDGISAGAFAEAKLRRLLELAAGDTALLAFITELIESL